MERIVSIVVVIVAIVLSALSVTLPLHRMADVRMFDHFFDYMVPILGTGALLKYLLWK